MRTKRTMMTVRTKRQMMATLIPTGRIRELNKGFLACITRRIFVRRSTISQVLRAENMQD